MKKAVILFAVTFFCSICFAQQMEEAEKLVREGIALHDKANYDAAIKKYDEALALDGNNYFALYEKSVSCLYGNRLDDCIAISKKLIEDFPDGSEAKAVYSNYGSALDDKGDTKEAVKIFNKGIKKFPDFHLLYFNKAVALLRAKEYTDAQTAFFDAMKLKPNHAGSLYYTSMLLEKSNKVAAILSCLTFLTVEPEGKRGETILKYLNELMGSFAKKENGSNAINITLGGFDDKKSENNFSMAEMMLGLTAASSLSDSVKAKTAVDKLSLNVQMLANSLSTGMKDGKGIFWKIYAPFFVEMHKKNYVPVFAHIASITSGDAENIKWINDNQEELKTFYEWVRDYKWNTGQ